MLKEDNYSEILQKPEDLVLKRHVNHKKVQIFRIISTLLLGALFLYTFYIWGIDEFRRILIFLTLWGYTMTFIYFSINTYYYYDEYPTFKLSTLFHMAFTLECVITIMFWAVIFPTQKNTSTNHLKSDDHSMKVAKFIATFLLHLMPIVLLSIDFSLNKIILKKENLSYLLVTLMLYFFVNFIAVMVFGVKIYSAINYKDFASYVYITLGNVITWAFWKLPLKLQKHKFILKDDSLISNSI